MKSRIPALVLAVFLNGAAHAGFDEGMSAYQTGDYARAFKEWQPLAAQGEARAQYQLGLMYGAGQGVAHDDAQALEWTRKAAQQGNAQAQFTLAMMYANGLGVSKDAVQALAWMRKAAQQGEVLAQNGLANMYAHGLGVPQDKVLAYMIYTLAARGGSALAGKQRNLLAEDMSAQARDAGRALAAAWKVGTPLPEKSPELPPGAP